MRSGVHAIISLDGAPVARADAVALGLAPSADPRAIVAEGVDRLQPGAVQVVRSAGRTTILLGFLDDRAAVAGALGLAADTPPATLARAALDRHGAEAARVLGGEWSLLDWTPQATRVLGSLTRRDPLLYAHDGARLALAPDLDRLARLPWVGRAIDPVGLTFAVARAALRNAGSGGTILHGVRKLAVGTLARFDAAGMTSETAPLTLPAARYGGSFEDAMEEVDRLLRRIVRERLAHAPAVACMLSGGLDSSLLTVLAAQERGAGALPLALCSSAAPESGLRDEAQHAQAVADALGLTLERVVPPAALSPYRPSEADMLGANGPSLSPRHHVYAALDARAAALGRAVMFDGSYGEMTVTSYHEMATVTNRMRGVWHRLRGRSTAAAGPLPGPVHVRLAPHRLHVAQRLADELGARPGPTVGPMPPRARWGVLADVAAMFAEPTARLSRRMEYPFRDPRLLALFASFPAAFNERDGFNRAPARHLLRGHVPDDIRQRRIGMAFSPDYEVRLQRDAPAALARIPAFRAAGLADWLDLDWLDEGLRHVAAHGHAAVAGSGDVQMTAMAAEYLLWWQDRP